MSRKPGLLRALFTGLARRLQRLVHAAAGSFFLMLVAGCAAINPNYDRAKPHHTRAGFQNNYSGPVNKSFGELVRWQVERVWQGLPKPPSQPVPTQSPDLKAIRDYAGSAQSTDATGHRPPAITWVGQASMLVQTGGLNVLTDPMFSERASPFSFLGPRRAQAPGIALAELPLIDVVLISHNHYDHLDTASVLDIAARSKAAGKPTLFLLPLGMKPWFTALGISHTIEMDWWDKQEVRGVEFHFTPVQHWSARSLGDRNTSLWGGFAVFAPDFHWYFSGDTGYSNDFADTRARFAARQQPANGGGFDLALIPIGAYQPRWFLAEQHIDPTEAVQVHKDLGAKRSVGVHWGTFAQSDEALDQPPKDLAAARHAQRLPDLDFSVMAIGETRFFPARSLP